MSVGGGKIEPFYFGSSAKPLFGLYHAPRPESVSRCAIVMCYPMGHEYIQFHRAFRLLGDQLCSADFPVLRFDFYGCGDSSGDSEDGRVHQWLNDISLAITELRRRSGILRSASSAFGSEPACQRSSGRNARMLMAWFSGIRS